ncbi:MAG: M15 family metallopeptidase [Anaerolineae bacterium]|nr:M15 family metallopeptidase [Anaerolineae bacterium]
MIKQFIVWLVALPIWRILIVLIGLALAVWVHERVWLAVPDASTLSPSDAKIDLNAPYLCPISAAVGPSVIATCIDCIYFPVDKTHALPATYQPLLVDTGLPGGGMVTPETKSALGDLFDEAHKLGLAPTVTSAYRSYEEQVRTFKAWVAQEFRQTRNPSLALANAARYSALPGHSEHQLGTVVDLNCAGCDPFDDKDERNLALWEYLADNAYRFGFVISYPRDIEARTGYIHEPWHIRYVGVEYAVRLFDQRYLSGNGNCLAGFLGRAAAAPELSATAAATADK